MIKSPSLTRKVGCSKPIMIRVRCLRRGNITEPIKFLNKTACISQSGAQQQLSSSYIGPFPLSINRTKKLNFSLFRAKNEQGYRRRLS